MPRDYYEILGLARGADKDAIKKAYRKLARKYHPDVSKEAAAEEHFKEVNEAYSVLSDEERRAKYDRFGHQAFQAGSNGPVDMPWEELLRMFGAQGGGAGGFGGGVADGLGAMFGSAFGGQRARPEPPRQAKAELEISMKTAVLGGTESVTLPPPLGGGTVELRIPPGSAEGQKMRLAGKGPLGRRGRGDLLLELRIKTSRRFRRTGVDLEADLYVKPSEAVEGCSVEVPSPEGKASLKVPPGVKSGQRLRLRSKGLPKKGSGRGDLYFRLLIVLPPEMDADSLAVLKELEGDWSPR